MDNKIPLSEHSWWNPFERWFRKVKDPRQKEARQLLIAVGQKLYPDQLDEFIGALGSGYSRECFETGRRVKATKGSRWIGRLLGLRRFTEVIDDYNEVPHRLPGADHEEVWMCGRKPMIWTSQPYHMDHDEIRATLDFCEAHGLEMRISGDSWHFPGATVLVTVERIRDVGENG